MGDKEEKVKDGLKMDYSTDISRKLTLEQEIKCENCTLEYTIYGVFGYCPDCGIHNSLQILKINFSVVKKMLEFSQTQELDLLEKMVENALEDTISAFDGFGREISKVNADKATNSSKAERISFQSIKGARKVLKELFEFDFAESVSEEDWSNIETLFQKRHLVAHKMGIIDKTYVELIGCPLDFIGRKISILPNEVIQLIESLQIVAGNIFKGMNDCK